MQRPQPGEYAPYYHNYIQQVPEGDILEILAAQRESTRELLHGLTEVQGDFRYAPGKWTIKELLGHLVDSERVFSYRAMAFARKDPAALPSMDQDIYVENGHFQRRTVPDLAGELYHQRSANILLFASFDEATGLRSGTASGFEFTVRCFPYIIAGHERHHIKVLREHYL